MIVIGRRLAVFLLGVAALVLAIIVLITHPADEVDLLAGAALGAGLGLVLLVAPAD
jgi:hypothetical protein